MTRKMLDSADSLLLVIDVQEKLVAALDKDIVVRRTTKLANAAKILEIPIIVTEQYPQGLGSTVQVVKDAFAHDVKIIEKTAFSAVKEKGFLDVLKSYNKKQIVVCGIETHICVHQTVCDLLDEGFEVYIVKDACASRNKYEFKVGVDRMQMVGANITCMEIAVFEWLNGARHPKFREVQALIK